MLLISKLCEQVRSHTSMHDWSENRFDEQVEPVERSVNGNKYWSNIIHF